jgi:hypothetical protein
VIIFELKEIINKLVGPIYPVGSHNCDEKRKINLNVLIDLVDDIVSRIDECSEYRNSSEDSVKAIGVMSYEFKKKLYDSLSDEFSDASDLKSQIEQLKIMIDNKNGEMLIDWMKAHKKVSDERDKLRSELNDFKARLTH